MVDLIVWLPTPFRPISSWFSGLVLGLFLKKNLTGGGVGFVLQLPPLIIICKEKLEGF